MLAVAPLLPVAAIVVLDGTGCRGWGMGGAAEPVCPGGPAAGWIHAQAADISFAMRWMTPLMVLRVLAMTVTAAALF